eukprot:s438_g27.t1
MENEEQRRVVAGRHETNSELRCEFDIKTFAVMAEDKKKRACKAAKSRFKRGDVSGDGRLDLQELSALLRRGDPTLKDSELRRLFREIDANADGRIDFGEFCDYLFDQENAAARPVPKDVKAAFEHFHGVNEAMSSSEFYKFCKEACLHNGSFRQSDAAIVFSKVKQKTQREIVAPMRSEPKKRKKGPRDFDWSKATFHHFVLKIAYVGTNYHGNAWQDPKICPTVEASLFEALIKTRLIQDRSSCNFSRCGRTDKGVHAAGNYISLSLRLKPGAEDAGEDFDYPSMLNGVLPPDIRVLASCRAPSDSFDARFSCLYRAYQYYFPHNGEDLELMHLAAQRFVGEHDFRNFCKMDIENVSNFRRRVLSASVVGCGNGVAQFSVTGVAFLWHQVRCMAAVLLLIGSKLEEAEVITELLDVDKWPRKPLYEPADESGLAPWCEQVLRDCGFPDVSFAPGCPAAPAGAVEWGFMAFTAMLQRHQRFAAVLCCLAGAAGAGGDGTTGAKRHASDSSPRLYVSSLGDLWPLKVINLEKREDRRRWMCRTLSCLPAFSEAGADVSLLQAVDGEEVEAPLAPWWPMDEAGLEATEDRWRELFPDEPLGREELRRFYGRAISSGEKGVFLSHRAAWEAAKGAPFTLILEDDAVPMSFLPPRHGESGDQEEAFLQLCCGRWASLWTALLEATKALEARRTDWHLLLLGRHRFGEDSPIEGEHDLVSAGFSTCLHAYCVSNRGAELLLRLTSLEPKDPYLAHLIPIDDFLPGLWSGQHPRRDLEEYLQMVFPDHFGCKQLNVVAFREDLAWQLESLPSADGQVVSQLFQSLMRSDIDIGSGWRAAAETVSEHPLTRLECLRSVAMAGPEAAEALSACAPALRSALDESSWRQLALALVQEQQNCRDEDPVLGRYIPGSWMLTCVYLLSGGAETPLAHPGSCAPRFPSGFAKVQRAADALEHGQKLGNSVDVRHAAALDGGFTVSEFRRCFETSKPLILKDADTLATSYPKGWGLDALHRSVAKRLCRCHIQDDALALTSGRTKLSVIRLPFDEYVTYMESHKDVEPLYLFQELEPDLKQAIDPSFHPPEIFKEDFLLDAYEPPEGFTGLAGWLLVGPPSSGSRWHFDPWSTAAWNLLFEGKKLWAFFPPSELGRAAPPKVEAQLLGGLASEARRFYAAPPVLTLADVLGTQEADSLHWVLQGPGDLIFIPSGWWHCTVSLTKTSAYTRNYINSHNYARAEEALAKLHPHMAKQLRTWIWRLHMDDSDEEDGPAAKKPRKSCKRPGVAGSKLTILEFR